MNNQRISWVDVSKALLIYLVLLGHIEAHADFVYMVIFTFHMPAFFILSGYTYKENNDTKNFIYKKFKNLIFPYFIFCFLGLIIRIINGNFYIFNHANLPDILQQVFITMQPNIFFSGTGWFLFALFWASIGGHLYIKHVRKSNKYFQCICLFLLCVFALNILAFNKQFLGIERLPFKLDSALMGLFFYLIGYYFKEYDLMSKISKHLLMSIVCVAVVYLLCAILTFGSNMANCNYFNPPLYILAALSGSVLIFIVSYFIDKIKHINMLRDIGKVTLPIFMLQGFFLYLAEHSLQIPIAQQQMFGVKAVIIALCVLLLEYPFAKLYFKIFKKK